MVNSNPINVGLARMGYYLSRNKNYEGSCKYDYSEYLHKDFGWYESTCTKGVCGNNKYNAYFKTHKSAERHLMLYRVLRKLRIVK